MNTTNENIHGDIIEIKLMDITRTTYFRSIAHINNKKEMLNLLQTIKEKGVSFPVSWFD